MASVAIELPLAQERLGAPKNIVRLSERSERKRLAQREHQTRFIEQPAHERRADVARVKDEVDRPRVANESHCLGHA